MATKKKEVVEEVADKVAEPMERDPRHPWVWLKTGEKAYLTWKLLDECNSWDSNGHPISDRAESVEKLNRWRMLLIEYDNAISNEQQELKSK